MRRRKKRKVWVFVTLAVFLIAALIAAIILLWSRMENEGISGEEKKRCISSAEEFLSRYQAEDGTAAEYLLFGGEEELTFHGISGLFARQMEYELKRVKADENGVHVRAEITNADFKKIAEAALGAAGENAEEFTNAFYGLLEEEEAPRRTFDCEIYMALENVQWKVSMTPELSNALTGGAAEYIGEYLAGGEGE